MTTDMTSKIAFAPPQRKPSHQFSLPGLTGIEHAVDRLAEAGTEQRGAIFTKREVVEFILDLVEYTSDRPLRDSTILEPSFGDGDFLLPIAERLIESMQGKLRTKQDWMSLANSIRGIELHKTTYASTKVKLERLLREHGCTEPVSAALANAWLTQEDFLLSEHSLRIPTHSGHLFRRMAATRSDRSRPPLR